MNKAKFKKRVYKELDRINKLYISLHGEDSILPVAFFNKNVVMGASARTIKEKIGLNFNDFKEAVELPIQRGRIKGEKVINGYSRKIKIPLKITNRICNMCENPFKAVANMRSCPSCTNTKNHSESYGCGLDEYNTGVIGGINR